MSALIVAASLTAVMALGIFVRNRGWELIGGTLMGLSGLVLVLMAWIFIFTPGES